MKTLMLVVGFSLVSLGHPLSISLDQTTFNPAPDFFAPSLVTVTGTVVNDTTETLKLLAERDHDRVTPVQYHEGQWITQIPLVTVAAGTTYSGTLATIKLGNDGTFSRSNLYIDQDFRIAAFSTFLKEGQSDVLRIYRDSEFGRPPVPEPASMVGLGVGLVAFARKRSRL